MCGSMSLIRMLVELDYKQVVHDISKSDFGTVLNACRVSHLNFKINFIRKQTNNIVYLLARTSLLYVSSHIYDHKLIKTRPSSLYSE